MRVLVAGASGVIGQRLVRILVASGHRVTGTTRSPERAATVRAVGATPLVVDVFDEFRLGDAYRARLGAGPPLAAYFALAVRGSNVSGKHCQATPPLLASRP